MKYFDITPKLSSDTAVFPGDQRLERSVSMDFKKGDHLLLSSIKSTLHIGAHTDAPNHYNKDGEDIASSDLKPYLGRAQVIEIKKKKNSRIEWSDLVGKKILAPRVLFKTSSFPNPNIWNGDFNALSQSLIQELAKAGVTLVGIDTPSVDPADDQTLESHREIYRLGLRILEGIVLEGVPEGIYTLMALPLPIVGGDASPVRALLIEKDLGIP